MERFKPGDKFIDIGCRELGVATVLYIEEEEFGQKKYIVNWEIGGRGSRAINDNELIHESIFKSALWSAMKED